MLIASPACMRIRPRPSAAAVYISSRLLLPAPFLSSPWVPPPWPPAKSVPADTLLPLHALMSISTTSHVPGVLVIDHPLAKHHLANLRLTETSARDFRFLVEQISKVLVLEATKDLPTHQVQGAAPLGQFTGSEVSTRIGVVPILRAGLGMTEAALSLLPDNTSVLHIGLFREKVSLQPVEYYNKVCPPPSPHTTCADLPATAPRQAYSQQGPDPRPACRHGQHGRRMCADDSRLGHQD